MPHKMLRSYVFLACLAGVPVVHARAAAAVATAPAEPDPQPVQKSLEDDSKSESGSSDVSEEHSTTTADQEDHDMEDQNEQAFEEVSFRDLQEQKKRVGPGQVELPLSFKDTPLGSIKEQGNYTRRGSSSRRTTTGRGPRPGGDKSATGAATTSANRSSSRDERDPLQQSTCRSTKEAMTEFLKSLPACAEAGRDGAERRSGSRNSRLLLGGRDKNHQRQPQHQYALGHLSSRQRGRGQLHRDDLLADATPSSYGGNSRLRGRTPRSKQLAENRDSFLKKLEDERRQRRGNSLVRTEERYGGFVTAKEFEDTTDGGISKDLADVIETTFSSAGATVGGANSANRGRNTRAASEAPMSHSTSDRQEPSVDADLLKNFAEMKLGGGVSSSNSSSSTQEVSRENRLRELQKTRDSIVQSSSCKGKTGGAAPALRNAKKSSSSSTASSTASTAAISKNTEMGSSPASSQDLFENTEKQEKGSSPTSSQDCPGPAAARSAGPGATSGAALSRGGGPTNPNGRTTTSAGNAVKRATSVRGTVCTAAHGPNPELQAKLARQRSKADGTEVTPPDAKQLERDEKQAAKAKCDPSFVDQIQRMCDAGQHNPKKLLEDLKNQHETEVSSAKRDMAKIAGWLSQGRIASRETEKTLLDKRAGVRDGRLALLDEEIQRVQKSQSGLGAELMGIFARRFG
ncbi:unnamed protein product [Amoebophrya sp. A25]|nr:unnamed protein product [Amoebophrya sp. A25]|eukprot:GSA25T00009321001.1